MSQNINGEEIQFEDDLTAYDPARRAGAVLSHVLREGENTRQQTPDESIAVEEAISGRTVIDRDTGRTMSRVLFVTSNQSVLVKNSSAQNEFLSLAGVFDEIHVMVLLDRKGKNSHQRLADNVWTYSVFAKHWWQLPFKASTYAEDILVFNGAVRPDVVVATDPYIAGLGAYWIAGAFTRPVQIQVHEDFTTEAFKTTKRASWKRRIATYLLKRVNSVRTATDNLNAYIKKRFKKIVDVRTLPHFYNLSGFKNSQPAFDIHEKYQDFVFTILAFAPITADSYLQNIFSALRPVLLNPRIGLIVVGTGPAKELYQEKVKLLGIDKNVVFLPRIDDEVSYFKSADLLFEMDTGKDSEERVLKAAAAGLPIVAATTEVREDLFKDGESAFLCLKDDVYCFGQKTNKFLNQGSLRIQFAKTAAEIVDTRVNEDPVSYYRAYRDSIEVIIQSVDNSEGENASTNPDATAQDSVVDPNNKDETSKKVSGGQEVGQISALGV